ncbi:hypothetical protein G5V58_12515 [Nocardioides anomalus]|uniref:Uncharacterized protein n=1 Tax=Nocardioides anomalus TaxID=2712223 RepID=A0A6G6WDS4_9ACTN|nr:hypothetical protein [Nocardioides anomalus]QIG43478.1 hypothetical protein G5V58_12515 [Nocardioides anomalus]
MTRAAVLVLAAVVSLLLGGCGDQKDQYCDAVKSHQRELGDLLGGGGADALLEALPVFRDLAGDAPDDIRDDWRTVVDALEGLRDALDDAGVDPTTYDRDQPPAGLTAKQKDAIDAAARRLTSPGTVAAFNAVDQQAKDVCGTPLQA